MSNKEVKKIPVYLFNDKNPKGEMFSFYGGKQSDEYKQMIKDGWVDTPAKLDLPKDMDTGVKEDDAKNADPQRLIKILEGYGFIVVTQEQLKAEANKMAAVAIDIANFSDEDLIKEAERRGLKKAPEKSDIDILQERFDEDPKELIIDELVKLGNDKFKLGLRSNMKEDTLIDKITEAMNAE